MKKLVSIVISVYNEASNIKELYAQLSAALAECDLVDYEIIFVNDGSSDDTLLNCKILSSFDNRIKIVNFTRNFGHEIAMTAGLDYSKGDAVIFMDGDLQHPPRLIPVMIQKWLEGHEIVLTKCFQNNDTSFVYKIMRKMYYKLINLISEVPITPNAPDFRLIGKKYINILKRIDEHDRMFRGLLNWIGFSGEHVIEFVPPKRFSGKSHYNFMKSMKLAVTSVVQFSTKPLRLATYVGIIAAMLSVCFGGWTIYEHFFIHKSNTGYASIICITVFVSSFQMIMLGILGEYIARIHIETKKRPLYFADFIEYQNETKN